MKATQFKMTELGPIPSDWEVKRLGEIGEPLMCKRILKSQTLDSGDVPFYKIGTFGGAADAYISQSLYESYRRKYSYPKKGDVLLSAAGTIGRAVAYDGRDAYFQDSNIVWLDNDESIVLNGYLYWWYKVISWKTEDGGIVTRLYNNNLKLSLIALPPLPEQRRIAAALSDVDELIGALGKLVEKKRAIKTGAMQRLLTGQTRLPGFGGAEFKQTELGPIPSDWEVKRLGECGAFIGGSVFPLSCQGEKSGDYPFFKVSDFSNAGNEYTLCYGNNYISKSMAQTLRCQIIPNQSIVFAKIGAAIALERKRIVNQDSCIDNNMMAYCVNNNENVHYFVVLLRQIKLADYSESTALPALNIKRLKDCAIVVPPLPEQRAIAAVLSDMDAEIAALEAEKRKVEAIKQGMMQELLTGKTRIGASGAEAAPSEKAGPAKDGRAREKGKGCGR